MSAPTAELSAKRMRKQLEKVKDNEASQSQVIEKLNKEKEDLLAEVAKCKYSTIFPVSPQTVEQTPICTYSACTIIRQMSILTVSL